MSIRKKTTIHQTIKKINILKKEDNIDESDEKKNLTMCYRMGKIINWTRSKNTSSRPSKQSERERLEREKEEERIKQLIMLSCFCWLRFIYE